MAKGSSKPKNGSGLKRGLKELEAATTSPFTGSPTCQHTIVKQGKPDKLCSNPQKNKSGFCRHHLNENLPALPSDKVDRISKVYGMTVADAIQSYYEEDPSDLRVELAILRKKLVTFLEKKGTDDITIKNIHTMQSIIRSIATIMRTVHEIETSKKHNLSINSLRIVINHINNIIISEVVDVPLRNRIANKLSSIPVPNVDAVEGKSA